VIVKVVSVYDAAYLSVYHPSFPYNLQVLLLPASSATFEKTGGRRGRGNATGEGWSNTPAHPPLVGVSLFFMELIEKCQRKRS